jgi:hypothetical protein
MGFRQALDNHGECSVTLENDLVIELHLDADFETDSDTGRTEVSFTDENNEDHTFFADTVVNYSTHPSHFE